MTQALLCIAWHLISVAISRHDLSRNKIVYWAKWRPDIVLQFFDENLIEMLNFQGSFQPALSRRPSHMPWLLLPLFLYYMEWTILIYSNLLVCDTILQGPQNEIWRTCELYKQPAFLGAAEDLCWPASSAAVTLPWCSGQLSCWPKHPWSLHMPQGFRKKELREIG